MNDKKIEEIENIIKKSGNNFHYKVIDFLRNAGWHVMVSPFYNDSYTDKPREIDIIAEKEYEAKDFWGEKYGNINIRFFIECKYITDNTVFWFDNRDKSRALEKVLSVTPLEDPRRYSMTEKHRYLDNSKVAKLFASESNKISDNDVIYKAITQSLNAMTYYEGRQSFIPENLRDRYNTITFLNYPLVVCNSFEKFWKYDVAEKGEPEQINNNFQMEVQYAYLTTDKRSINEYFLLDIIDFNNFDTFLKELESKDILAVREKLRWDEKDKNK